MTNTNSIQNNGGPAVSPINYQNDDMTMRAIRIHSTGPAEVLSYDSVPRPIPRPCEVRVRLSASGVNFKDVYLRSGLYPVELPHILGEEGAGIVDTVGENAGDWKVGDRVAWVLSSGTYAEYACVPSSRLVRVPDAIDLTLAAATMLQGMTAHYLSHDCFPLAEGHKAVVHAAAGGVGSLLVQLAKQRGAQVIATVSSETKAALARSDGADDVIIYRDTDVPDAVRDLTRGIGADVVYDSVGRDTYLGSLDSLRPRGTLVLFGQSSGPVPAIDPMLLSRKGSLFLTRPTLVNYIHERSTLMERSAAIFSAMTTQDLQVRTGAIFPLHEATDSHRLIESRQSMGKVLLTMQKSSTNV